MKKRKLIFGGVLATCMLLTSCSISNIYFGTKTNPIVPIPSSKETTPSSTPASNPKTTPSTSIETHVHEFQLVNETAASCEAPGKKEYTCSCGEKKEEVIQALGHEYIEGSVQPATCLEEGYGSGVVCKTCGKLFSSVTIPALGHDYVESKATTANGHSYTLHSCSRCEDTYGDHVIFDYTKNYDYQQFSKKSLYAHSDAYVALYKEMYDSCMEILASEEDYVIPSGKSFYSITSFDYAENGIGIHEAHAILNSFILYNPEFYFLTSGYTYTSSKIFLNMNNDYLSGEKRKTCQSAIREMEESYYRAALKTPASDTKEAAKRAHDFIINTIDYAYASTNVPSNETWAHNILGVAEKRGGVCEAYSKTYLYLCGFSGIDSTIIAGIGNGGGHAWNYTKMNGSWYGVDVTWDDQKTTIYKYFMTDAATMDEAHQAGGNSMIYSPKAFTVSSKSSSAYNPSSPDYDPRYDSTRAEYQPLIEYFNANLPLVSTLKA